MTIMKVAIIAKANKIKTQYKAKKQEKIKAKYKAKLAALDASLFLFQKRFFFWFFSNKLLKYPVLF